MNRHETKEAIDANMTSAAADYWHGMARDLRDEVITHAQEHGVEAAVVLVEELAAPSVEDA